MICVIKVYLCLMWVLKENVEKSIDMFKIKLCEL